MLKNAGYEAYNQVVRGFIALLMAIAVGFSHSQQAGSVVLCDDGKVCHSCQTSLDDLRTVEQDCSCGSVGMETPVPNSDSCSDCCQFAEGSHSKTSQNVSLGLVDFESAGVMPATAEAFGLPVVKEIPIAERFPSIWPHAPPDRTDARAPPKWLA